MPISWHWVLDLLFSLPMDCSVLTSFKKASRAISRYRFDMQFHFFAIATQDRNHWPVAVFEFSR